MTLKLLSAAALIALPASAWAQTTGTTDGPANPPSAPAAEAATPAGDAQTSTTAPSSEAATSPESQAAGASAVGAGAEAASSAGEITAATAADLRAGAEVRDTQGGIVGTVVSADADGAVVNTGSVRAKLALASFGRNGQGLVISMTKAEFETAARGQSSSHDNAAAESEDQQ